MGMAHVKIVFNQKEYTIPSDLKEYLTVLNLAEDLQNNLCDGFMQKALRAESKVVEPDEINDLMRDCSEKFIQRLCEKGVYDKTIDDYAFQNEGYIEFLNVTKDAMQAIMGFLSEEAQDYERGQYVAKQRALSGVTGSGVSVYSSSILTLALASAVEYTTLQGQCSKADAQYTNDLKRLREQGASKRARKENGYFATQYCPKAKSALRKFVYCLMGRYLDDLIAENCFDKETLQYVDIKHSQEILKNLKISSNKDAVLEKAFLVCPFNIDVYVELGRIGKLDEGTFKTASELGQADYVKNRLYELVKKLSYTGNFCEDLVPVEGVITSLSNITGEDKTKFYKEFASPIYQNVIEQYQKIQMYASDINYCRELLDKNTDCILNYTNSDLQSIAEKEVKGIISDQEFYSISIKGGYYNFLTDISMGNVGFFRKQELDSHYVNEILKNLVRLLPEQQKNIIEGNQAKETARIKKLDDIQKEKRKAIVLMVMLLVVPLIVVFSTGYIWEDNVKSGIEKHIQAKIDNPPKMGSAYWKYIGGVKSFEIKDIKYIDSPIAIYVMPEIVYHIGSNSATESEIEMVMDSIYQDYWNSVPFYISFGNKSLRLWPGETIVHFPNGKEIVVEKISTEYARGKGTEFNPQIPIPMVVFYIIYALITVFYLKRKLKRYDIQEKKYQDTTG